MNNLSLGKYLKKCIISGLTTFVCLLMFVLCFFIEPDKALNGLTFAVLTIAIGSVFFKDASKYFRYKKLYDSLETKEGIISNWSLVSHGRIATHAAVELFENLFKYVSDDIFSSSEAQELVGKKVKYAVFEGTLIIYEVL